MATTTARSRRPSAAAQPAPAAAAPLPDAAWHTAQYDNRARVPEFAQHLARWQQASVLARSRMTSRIDQPYGPAESDKLDVFPARADGAPVLVFIHGGYWRALDKSDHSFIAPAFVQAGAMVVVPNYALAPAVGIGDIALQLTRALAWTALNAQRHGGDPSRIVVAGHSAGGHLAAMLLACDWATVGRNLGHALPARLVSAALSISGLFDLAPIRRTPFLQADLKLTEADVPRLSPAAFPRPAGRLHAWVGGDESEAYRGQNALIRQRWGARTVPVCAQAPGRNHFSILTDFVDTMAPLHASARELLGLGPTPSTVRVSG